MIRTKTNLGPFSALVLALAFAACTPESRAKTEAEIKECDARPDVIACKAKVLEAGETLEQTSADALLCEIDCVEKLDADAGGAK